MKAVLLISHGSRSDKTIEEVARTLEKIKRRNTADIYAYAFLELQSPSISEGIDQCVAEGAKKIIVLLNFLNAGRHVDEDIPEIISQSRQKHSAIDISITKPIGQHEGIVDLFADLTND